MNQVFNNEPAASSVDTGTPTSAKPAKSKREVPAASKTEIVLKKLRTVKGVTVQQLAEATGWQVHSVRGFLSGTVRKKLGLNLVSDVGKDSVRRYRIVDQAPGGEA